MELTQPLQHVIDEILAGPDFFTCARTHTRMRKTACVQRQRGAATGSGITSHREIPPECRGCEQGEELKRELAGAGQGSQPELVREIEEVKMKATGKGRRMCTVPGCEEPVSSGRLCDKHRVRRQTHEKNETKRVVILDFGPHPELWGELQDSALEDLRTIDQQAIALLRERLGEA